MKTRDFHGKFFPGPQMFLSDPVCCYRSFENAMKPKFESLNPKIESLNPKIKTLN